MSSATMASTRSLKIQWDRNVIFQHTCVCVLSRAVYGSGVGKCVLGGGVVFGRRETMEEGV